MTGGGQSSFGRWVAASLTLAAIGAIIRGSLAAAPAVLAVCLCLATIGVGVSAVRRAPPAPRLPAARGRAPVYGVGTSTPGVAVAEPVELQVEVFTRSKLGADASENEDAAAVADDGHVVAVADGASSAFASGAWSQLLVEGYVAHGHQLGDGERVAFVADQAEAWRELVAGTSDAPWWEDAARQKGSFAAFVGVTIDDRGEWRAQAVGDCCVIVIREGKVQRSFPIETATAFTSTPSLLTTTDAEAGHWLPARGQASPGDALLVASDGLAAWLLADPEPRVSAVLAGDGDRAALVDAEREAQRMENDDITMVVVQVGAAAAVS